MKTAMSFFVLLISSLSWSMQFSDFTGDYTMTGCIGAPGASKLDYCDYDEVKVSTPDTTSVKFEFLLKGQSELQFSIVPQTSKTDTVDTNTSNSVSLTSSENQVQSATSLTEQDGQTVLKMSSTSATDSFRFNLYLQKKTN